ncbi:MAG: hypothetical protein M1839_001064 [Geoglossum umbratile]|nr:MAG: hypothetical protein M1839_001064 [Geoglossum umbratile]
MSPTHRITLFKIASDAHRDLMLSHYSRMKQTALKATPPSPSSLHPTTTHQTNTSTPKQDGSPYILSIVAGKPADDQRAQGYTLAVHSQFSCKEDMEFYDSECETHKKLKADMAGKLDGVLMVYFEQAF